MEPREAGLGDLLRNAHVDAGMKRITNARVRPGDYRLARIERVALQGVVMDGVRLFPPHFRGGVITSSDFDAVRWHQGGLVSFAVRDTTYRRLAADGLRMSKCKFRNSHLLDAALQNATFVDCTFSDLSLSGTFDGRVFFDQCELARVKISGFAEGLLMPRTTALRDVDLSALEMRNSEISGELHRVKFPTTRTSFVVPRSALTEVIGPLRGRASDESVDTYERYLSVFTGDFAVVDDTLFDLRGLGAGTAFTDHERQALLGLLYPRRVSEAA